MIRWIQVVHGIHMNIVLFPVSERWELSNVRKSSVGDEVEVLYGKPLAQST